MLSGTLFFGPIQNISRLITLRPVCSLSRLAEQLFRPSTSAGDLNSCVILPSDFRLTPSDQSLTFNLYQFLVSCFDRFQTKLVVRRLVFNHHFILHVTKRPPVTLARKLKRKIFCDQTSDICHFNSGEL